MNILRLKQQARGWHFQCSDAPDMTAMNTTAAAQAKLSQEQLDWAKAVYQDTSPDRAAAASRANAVSDAQLASMNTQTALSQDYADYNRNTFRPLEQGIVADAAGYDTPQRREEEAAKATAGVEMSLANQRNATSRSLERSGVAPGSGKQLALAGAMDLGSAKLMAGAANQARTQVETIGAARKMDAANLGRGLASSQATSAGLALTAGNNSAANSAATGNIAAQGNSIMTSGYSGAQQGLAGASNTYGNIANLEQKAGDNSAIWGAVGSVAGAYMGKPSDKNIKNDRKKISGKMSLAQVKNLPSNESWRYNKGSVADDGGKLHQGHMAQDVNRVMGNNAAPGGKVINLEHLASIGLASIKEVAKGQEKIDRRLMRLENARPKASAKR